MTRRRQGFTVVEVMISLGVMTIGAMALISMQQQTTRANVHAREISTAMQIAQTWIERFKLDGMRWNNVGDSTTDLAATSFIGINTGDGTTTTGAGFEAIPVTTFQPIAGLYAPNLDADSAPNFIDGLSNGFDYYGNDVSVADMSQVHFCAAYRVRWVFRNVGGGGTNPTDDRALRVDVRVWWAKDISGKTNANRLAQDFPLCGGAVDHPKIDPGGTEFNNYHVVYLSTVIRPVR